MLFLIQIKTLFSSFIINNFTIEAQSAPEQNTQDEKLNFEDYLRQALEDNTLDWEDLNELQALSEHYSEDKWEVFAETKEWLQSIVVEMLQSGYTVNNENDYNALKNIMSIVDSWYKIPTFQDMISQLPENNREKFSFVLNNNKDRLLVYVMEKHMNSITTNTDEYWFIDLWNWEFDDSTWNSDFLTSFDDEISNNNQVSIDDIVYRKTKREWRGSFTNEESSLDSILDRESKELEASKLRELITREWYIMPSPDTFNIDALTIPENIDNMSFEELSELKSNIDFYNWEVQSHLDKVKQDELLAELNNITIDGDIPEWFQYDWETPSKPEDLSTMSIEELEWLISQINKYNSSVEDFRKQQEILDRERELQERLDQEKKSLNKARMFYERVWSTSSSIKELQSLLLSANESLPEYWADWWFWKETFIAIKSFQQKNWLAVDWMAWSETLKALWVESSLSEFYTWKSEVLDSQTKESSSEENQENPEEESFIDEVWESISEWYSKIKEWIAEIFRTNEDIREFIWVNWKAIKLEFDETWPAIHVDTPFFDWISDFPLSNIPSNLSSLEDAKLFVESNIDNIKEEYNSQYFEKIINRVNNEKSTNSTVGRFETYDWKELNVNLSSRVDNNNNDFEWAYIYTDTALFWDWIRDSQTRVDLLDSNWWEITREQIEKAVNESISKYKKLEQEQLNKQDIDNQGNDNFTEQSESLNDDLSIANLLNEWAIDWLGDWETRDIYIDGEKYYISKSKVDNNINFTKNMMLAQMRAHVIRTTTPDLDPSDDSSYHEWTLNWFKLENFHIDNNFLYILAK